MQHEFDNFRHLGFLKRTIEDILFYRIEDQDEDYRPTIRIVGTWIFDDVSGAPIYLYFNYEYSRKNFLNIKPKVWAEGEHSSLKLFDLEMFRVDVSK